jgi:hypothetical protein
LASESSLVVVDLDAPVKRESILRMFRKATKVVVDEQDKNNCGLKKSASTVFGYKDNIKSDLSLCQLN